MSERHDNHEADAGEAQPRRTLAARAWRRLVFILEVIALGLIVTLLPGCSRADALPGAEAPAPSAAPARVQAPACPAQWISQAGPNERAVRVCVDADLTRVRELPAHLLTLPVAQ